MNTAKAVKIGIDVLKFVGNIAKDVATVEDYRVTVILEKRIDDKMGVVVDNISVDKQMSVLQANLIMRNIREMLKRKEI